MGEESNSVRGVNGRTLEMISYRGVKHRFVASTLVLTTNLIIVLDTDMILFASPISAKLLHNSI